MICAPLLPLAYEVRGKVMFSPFQFTGGRRDTPVSGSGSLPASGATSFLGGGVPQFLVPGPVLRVEKGWHTPVGSKVRAPPPPCQNQAPLPPHLLPDSTFRQHMPWIGYAAGVTPLCGHAGGLVYIALYFQVKRL